MRRRQQSTHFSEILARIEKSKKHEDDERVGSFSKNSRMLASFGGGLGAGFGMDAIGNEGGMPVNAVLKEVSALKKGQEDEAKRSRDRSEAISKLELHCGVLDDKLELILSMLTSMRGQAGSQDGAIPGDGKSFNASFCGANKSFARRMSSLAPAGASSAPGAHGHCRSEEVVRADGQVLHRRRKPKASLAFAVRTNIAMQ